MAKLSEVEADFLLFEERVSAPATPSIGFWEVYFKSDGLYIEDDGGTETGPFVAADYEIETESGTTFTPALADAFTYQRLTNASAVTVTIPPNSSVAYPVGTWIDFYSAGAGGATLDPGSGVTLNGNTTVAQWERIRAVKVATDTWDCDGGTSA